MSRLKVRHGDLAVGRAAFHRSAWREAYSHLTTADRTLPLGPEDLERLATAACLLGRETEGAGYWARAHAGHLASGEVEPAVRCALRLALGLLDRGEAAQCAGWIARARRLLEEHRRDCAERGYLMLADGVRLIGEGECAASAAASARAAAIAERFADADLSALARHGQGRALIRLGRTAEGVALLDEAMVAVTTGEVSPLVAGDVYCGVISGCQEVFDWRRAQEWTAALTRWCAAQAELVAYRGQCLLRRAELLLLHGEWSEAAREARLACERLAEPAGQAGLGSAFYQLGEIHRFRGDFAASDEAYRQASLQGRRPYPGLALLRLAQEQVSAASAAIRTAAAEAREPRARPRLLAAVVEIALAAGDVSSARAAAEELARAAAVLEAPYLRALARQSAGAVLLAQGDARAALNALREAESVWRDLKVPYERARARALAGLACRELGDPCGAAMELEAAAEVLKGLGAVPDLARVQRLRESAPGDGPTALTPRELEVLRLVAAGMTNRAVATRLRISEKTVARHVSNIFLKLGISSRAAATAYAYRHALVST